MTAYSLRIMFNLLNGYKQLRDYMPVLLTLHLAGSPMDFAACAREAKVHKTHLDRAMNTLITHGFACRKKNEEDRRKMWVSITPAGRAFVLKLCGVAT